jgi:DNA-binding NtrC family response regulator
MLVSLGNERVPLVIVVEDSGELSRSIFPICDYLSVAVKHVGSDDDLTPILAEQRPMAVLADMDAHGQDGCHVMKTVARHDPSLPILLITGDNPALAGAADAVEEIWGLSNVRKNPSLPELGELVDFLFQAGHKGQCLGLLPA